MESFKIGNAIVRIHNSYDPEKLKVATENFIKKVERKRKNEKKNASKST